ncbi:MAG TPA: CAP domain-containing protein [Aggregatilineales bacterium]|nr:CAP domain-containing protein [Anaerolineales bacterium]HRE46478.1 CAP domain-containing protein [Aggregatilineales bacterium]
MNARRCFLLLIAALLLVPSVIAPAPASAQNTCFPANQENNPDVVNAFANDVLKRVNGFRAENKLPPVTLNPLLNKAARVYADDMKYNGYPYATPHIGTDGSTADQRIAAAGYEAHTTGENIAGGPGPNAEFAFNQWYTSTKGHREQMIREDVSEMGIAFTCTEKGNKGDGPGQYYYVQVFGFPVKPVETIRQEFLNTINSGRMAKGLKPIAMDPILNTIADKAAEKGAKKALINADAELKALNYTYKTAYDIYDLATQGLFYPRLSAAPQKSRTLAMLFNQLELWEPGWMYTKDDVNTRIGIGIFVAPNKAFYFDVLFVTLK